MHAPGEADQLRAFFEQGRRRQYQKNEHLLRAGNEPDGVYLIAEGLVKIYNLDRQGNQHVTHFFGPGDFFPMIWLFRGQLRSVNYQALEPVSVWVVSKADFMKFVTQNQSITWELLEEMVKRYLRYAGRIENLLYSDARERCAYRLLSLANRFGKVTPDGLTINATITHEDIARSLNMTRETFGRCLSRLLRKNIIAYDKQRHIVIKDMSALVRTIGREEAETQWPKLMKFIID